MKIQTRKILPVDKVKRLMKLQAIMKEIKPEIDELKADLLKITQDLDVLSLKTGEYTISRAKRITPKIEDYEMLKKSLTEAGLEVYTQEVFAPQMDVVFKQAIEEGRELKGLDSLVTEYITIRLAK